MSFDKIKIISTRLKYGVSPSPADEVEQHVTIWSNGEVKISRYVFGDIRSGYVKAWSDTFYITTRQSTSNSAASSEKRWRGHIRSGFSMAVWRKEGAGMSFA